MRIEELYLVYESSTAVTTDTRSIAPGNIFFALKGEKFNANAFAAQAFEKGAAYVVVDEITEPNWKDKFGDKLILVDDVLKTLQQLAGHHRQQLKCPVLAITGSNGKTTTKELIAAVLSKKYKTHATKGNFNNHIGVPLTLLAIGNDVEFAVIEMGANHVGEIASYCEYAAPGFGLITNVGIAHTEGFGGFEGVVKGKTELYNHIGKNRGKIFVNAGNDILMGRAAEFGLAGENVITYGKDANAYCSGNISSGDESLSVQTEGVSIKTNLVGDYNFENVMSAVCIGKYFGVSTNDIKVAIEEYAPDNNRSQKITQGTNTIILDAYNANPSSMAEALKNFEKIQSANKVVILGEMMELGAYAKAEHEKIYGAVNAMTLGNRVFTGKGFEFVQADKNSLWFETTEELKAWFKKQRWDNCYMLIKGSRKNGLEKILE